MGQQYLPTAQLGLYFYSPLHEGYDAQGTDRLARWRGAQRQARDGQTGQDSNAATAHKVDSVGHTADPLSLMPISTASWTDGYDSPRPALSSASCHWLRLAVCAVMAKPRSRRWRNASPLPPFSTSCARDPLAQSQVFNNLICPEGWAGSGHTRVDSGTLAIRKCDLETMLVLDSVDGLDWFALLH